MDRATFGSLISGIFQIIVQAASGHVAVVEYLIGLETVDVNAQTLTAKLAPIHLAVAKNHIEVQSFLNGIKGSV